MPENWTQDTLKISAGVELFYTRTGRGDKPTLVLAHGITDHGLCWHQLARDLEADYDLILYDAYGHGKSSRIDPEKRFDFVEDLHDLIIGLKLEKPGLIGHSMGAATAAGFAAKYPEMPACVILEDPPWSDQAMSEKDFQSMMQKWKKDNLAAKEKTIKQLVTLKKKESPHWEEAILSEWAQSKHDVDPAVFDHNPIKKSNWRELAKAIAVPTLVITGDQELGAIIAPKLGVEAVKTLKKGEFGHISKAGHCVRYEQYQPYLTMIRLFLKRNMP